MKRILMMSLVFATFIGLAGAAMAADGAAVYKAKCTMCHGADGGGTPMGNAFKDNKFISSSSDEAIAEVIVKGRTGDAKKYKNFAMGMPAQKLSNEEVSAVVAYLRSLASK